MKRISGLISIATAFAAGTASAHPSPVGHVLLADGSAHASSGWAIMLGVIALGLCAVLALSKTDRRKP